MTTSYLHIDSQKHFVQHNGVRWAHVEYGSDNGETKQPTWSCSQCNDVESLCPMLECHNDAARRC